MMRRKTTLIGIVGDSGAGKSTFVNNLAQLLGKERVTVIGLDDYHSLDRAERKAVGITPLNPRANNLGLFMEHVERLRRGEKILKPVYDHDTGTFGEPEWVKPREFVICEGLHSFLFEKLGETYDYKIYYDTHRDLKIRWKIQRDAAHRGYTVEQVVQEIRQRQRDIRNFVEPQMRHADLVISLLPHTVNGQSTEAIKVRLAERTGANDIVHRLITLHSRGILPCRCFKEWYWGREMNVVELTEEITPPVLEAVADALGWGEKAEEKELTPFGFMLLLVARRGNKHKSRYWEERGYYAVNS
ncbi:MAG: phosphoribulokinase [Bacillota bacterium]